MSDTGSIDPEDELRLQIHLDTKYEFLLERNAIDTDVTPNRKNIREAVNELSQAEKKVLESRLRQKMRKLDELLEEDRKTFDEPYAEHGDLVDGVRIPGFYD